MPKLLTATKISPLDIFLSKSEELKSKGFEVIIPAFNNYDELFTVAAEVVGREDISVSVPVAVLSSAPGKGKAFREEIIYPIRSLGYRIVLLPGDKAEDSTKELVRAAAGMGIFDFVFDPYKGEDILFRILNPATLADMGSLLEEHKRTEHEEDIKNIKKNKNRPAIAHWLREVIGWLLKQKESQMSSDVCSSKEEEKEDGTLKNSEIDTLTGCYTRAYFEKFRPPEKYSVVFIDLDQFKPVNDILGHEMGDRVLAAFGQTILENIKGKDVVVRYGGDEFVILLPNTSRVDAENVVANIKVAWEKAAPDTGNLKVGFSSGVSEEKETLADALKTADRAMYQIKNSTRQVLLPALQPVTAEAVVAPGEPNLETPLQVTGKVLSTLIKIFTTVILFSIFIWFSNSFFKVIGVKIPLLEAIEKVLLNLWKDLLIGFL
ncbi:MAG: putative diguanylate cyclase YdaM [Pelotomaculum sp. PtaB.Bin104]|nr:MAG: putative diguanylate cyclase YdaM [Pelotomaculum sp. PtaB.Bin104]